VSSLKHMILIRRAGECRMRVSLVEASSSRYSQRVGAWGALCALLLKRRGYAAMRIPWVMPSAPSRSSHFSQATLVVVWGASSVEAEARRRKGASAHTGFDGSGASRPLEKEAIEVDSFVFPSGENTVELHLERRPGRRQSVHQTEMSSAFMVNLPESPIAIG